MKNLILSLAVTFSATTAFADGHAPAPMVMASNQSVENGVVSADKVVAGENGWMVVHDVSHARLKLHPQQSGQKFRKDPRYSSGCHR